MLEWLDYIYDLSELEILTIELYLFYTLVKSKDGSFNRLQVSSATVAISEEDITAILLLFSCLFTTHHTTYLTYLPDQIDITEHGLLD